jgi:hypothetical protein
MTFAEIRAMEKPKKRPERMNLWPRRLLRWKIVMLSAAEEMKKARMTAEMGMSTERVGVRPRPAYLGGYGGPFVKMLAMILDEGDDDFVVFLMVVAMVLYVHAAWRRFHWEMP